MKMNTSYFNCSVLKFWEFIKHEPYYEAIYVFNDSTGLSRILFMIFLQRNFCCSSVSIIKIILKLEFKLYSSKCVNISLGS